MSSSRRTLALSLSARHVCQSGRQLRRIGRDAASARGACRERGDASSGSFARELGQRQHVVARQHGGDAFGERRIGEQQRQVGGVVDRPEIVAQAEVGEFERGHAVLAPQRERQDQHQPAVGGIAHRDGDGLRAERGADVAMQRIEPARRLERGRARALDAARDTRRSRKSKASTATSSNASSARRMRSRGEVHGTRCRSAERAKARRRIDIRAARLPRLHARVTRENRISRR